MGALEGVPPASLLGCKAVCLLFERTFAINNVE